MNDDENSGNMKKVNEKEKTSKIKSIVLGLVSLGPSGPVHSRGPFLETLENFPGPKSILGPQYSRIAIQFLLILKAKSWSLFFVKHIAKFAAIITINWLISELEKPESYREFRETGPRIRHKPECWCSLRFFSFYNVFLGKFRSLKYSHRRFKSFVHYLHG